MNQDDVDMKFVSNLKKYKKKYLQKFKLFYLSHQKI